MDKSKTRDVFREKLAKLLETWKFHHNKIADTLDEIDALVAAKESTTSLVKRLFDYWAKLWKRRYQDDYVFTGAKDGAGFKRLLKKMEGEELALRIKLYLEDTDEWLVEKRHPLNVFMSTVNRYGPPTAAFTLSVTPVDCGHTPRCKTDVEHTRRAMKDLRS